MKRALEEQYLLANMQAAVGKRVNLFFKEGGQKPFDCRLDDVLESCDSRRLGRWVAIIDNGMLQTFDIFAKIGRVELKEQPYRNWAKINDVPCPLMRAALFATRSPLAITKLQGTFPECFQKTAPKPITWKQLYDKAIEISLSYGGSDLEYVAAEAQWHLLEALEFFNIPTVLQWEWKEHHSYPPKEIWEQFVGNEIKQPIFINYKGIRCIPAHIPFPCGTPNSNHEYQGHRKIFEKDDVDEMGFFALVAAEMIDFDD